MIDGATKSQKRESVKKKWKNRSFNDEVFDLPIENVNVLPAESFPICDKISSIVTIGIGAPLSGTRITSFPLSFACVLVQKKTLSPVFLKSLDHWIWSLRIEFLRPSLLQGLLFVRT